MTPTLILVLGGLLVAGGVTLALAVVGVATEERRVTSRNLAAIKRIDMPDEIVAEVLVKPFSERVVAPLGERMVGLGRKLTRADTAARIQHKLDIAGNPAAWSVNRLIGLKALGMLVLGSLAGVYLLSKGVGTAILGAGAGGAFGYLLPNILLNNAGEKREQQMLKSLPDAVDLLTISVEAGLGFDAAVSRVAKESSGPLALEFARLLQEMQIGVGRTQAMRAMAERTTLEDFKSFCLAMVQADTFGIGIADMLRVQSTEMRAKRRARAEEKAQRVPVKLLFPLIFFIMPTLFIVLLGPVILAAMASFG